MCYVIVTARSLAWLLISIVAFMLQLAAIMTPKWLIGHPVVDKNGTVLYTPSVGIYTRCTRLGSLLNHCASFSLDGFATDSSVYPSVWKASLFFLALGTSILCVTIFAGVFACCIQLVFKKSVISLAGATQAFAGVWSVCGTVLHPWGWGQPRVQRICGPDAQPFFMAECSIGWSLYACAAGVALTFVASALSKPADRAANSDKVQFQMDEGRQLICLA